MKSLKYLSNIKAAHFSFICIIGFCLSFSVLAVELKEHEASYIAKIKKGVSLKGKAIRSLKKIDGNKWLYRFEVESIVADIKESTVLTEQNQLITSIPNNTYDQLSYQLQLLLDVSNNKTDMTYQLAHKAKLRESQFVVLGEEVIDTQFGKLNSISAKKQRDDDAKRETYLWFSTDYPLLLLKMTQKEKDGEEYEIELSSAVIDGVNINLSEKVIAE